MKVLPLSAVAVLVLCSFSARQALPVVAFDLGHHNLIAENAARVESVSAFLKENGYAVRTTTSAFDSKTLSDVKVLLIINARAERNVKDWSLPAPSAFTADEITTVQSWVQGGGGLFLVAEHMPIAGAAEDLASAFGIKFTNGFVLDESKLQADNKLLPLGGAITFQRANGTLKDHPVTNGRNEGERVDSVSFDTGSVFSVTGNATPLLRIPRGYVTLTPQRAWQFTPEMPRVPAEGGLQGAALQVGRGRVLVFADAGAVMTRELAAKQTDPQAALSNARLFVNSIGWLSGALN